MDELIINDPQLDNDNSTQILNNYDYDNYNYQMQIDAVNIVEPEFIDNFPNNIEMLIIQPLEHLL